MLVVWLWKMGNNLIFPWVGKLVGAPHHTITDTGLSENPLHMHCLATEHVESRQTPVAVEQAAVLI